MRNFINGAGSDSTAAVRNWLANHRKLYACDLIEMKTANQTAPWSRTLRFVTSGLADTPVAWGAKMFVPGNIVRGEITSEIGLSAQTTSLVWNLKSTDSEMMYGVVPPAPPSGMSLASLTAPNNSGNPAVYLSSLVYPPSGSSSGGSATSTGNLPATSNVSKENVHTLLYAGHTTKIFCNLQLWFGQSDHRTVGYSCNDATWVASAIADIISRGFDGVVCSWYGDGNAIDTATQLVKTECEKHPGFTFMLQMDRGAIQYFSPSGYTPQQAAVHFVQYAESTYWGSSNYYKIGGQPVMTFFGVGVAYPYPTVDFTAMKAAQSNAHGVPIYWGGENTPAFAYRSSQGAFAWVPGAATDGGAAYLSNFYSVAQGTYPSETATGGTWPGFNDNLASWSTNRVMAHNAGQTWLAAWALANSNYGISNQLSTLLVGTWNDYEEATEIETGIGGGLTINSVSTVLNALNWTVTGSDTTLVRFNIYLGPDSSHLSMIGTAVPTARSFTIPPQSAGNYVLYVQAVGQPCIANVMSGSAAYVSTTTTMTSSSLLSSLSILQSFRHGLWDNGLVTIYKMVMPTPGDGNTFGAAEIFTGRIADPTITRKGVTLKVNSLLELLDQLVPTNLIEPSNPQAQYGAGQPPAGLASVPTFSTQGGASDSVFSAACTAPTVGQLFTAETFDFGYVLFTSGNNQGIYRTVRRSTLKSGYNQFALYQPLPWVPQAGDTFQALVPYIRAATAAAADTHTIPNSGPFTVVVTLAGSFVADAGVNYHGGAALTLVSVLTSTGQYIFSNTGTYTFFGGGDAGRSVDINYRVRSAGYQGLPYVPTPEMSV